MINKNYIFDAEGVNEIVNEMFESNEYMCGLNEIVRKVCGNEFYGNYDEDDLKYVEEVMREFCNIKVSFDLENEVMNYEGDVES